MSRRERLLLVTACAVLAMTAVSCGDPPVAGPAGHLVPVERMSGRPPVASFDGAPAPAPVHTDWRHIDDRYSSPAPDRVLWPDVGAVAGDLSIDTSVVPVRVLVLRYARVGSGGLPNGDVREEVCSWVSDRVDTPAAGCHYLILGGRVRIGLAPSPDLPYRIAQVAWLGARGGEVTMSLAWCVRS